MKKILTLFILTLLVAVKASAAILAINGKVIDKDTHEALAGAIVSIPELKIAVNTDNQGRFSFLKIPAKGRFVIEIRYLGYQTFTKTIDLSQQNDFTFAISPSTIEVHEVVVTGTPSGADNRSNSTAVSAIGKAEMISQPNNNIIDAIAKVPGVAQITTGAAVSKPVIRGLSYNRVITLSDGVKQEGQQWGDEHGIEIDQYNADRVEILRGAASLIYGSDAMGGVINILDPLPLAEGKIKGEFLSNYASNNGLTGSSAMLQGNSNGFVWRARGSYKNAFSYNTPDGRVSNTAFNEDNFSGLVGLNRNWGYTHINFSSFHTKLGIPGGGHDHEEEASAEEDHENEFLEGTTSRKLQLPFQDINHYKLAINNQIVFGKGRLRSTLAYQNNQRRELEESFDTPSLFFDLKTYSYDVKYYFQTSEKWEPVIGVSGAVQNSKNKAEELLIPDYKSNEVGAFAYLKRTWKSTSVNAGVRYDYRNFKGLEMLQENAIRFGDFSNNFSNISGALGLTHNISHKLTIKANAGSAFRSPNIAELSSNGVHEGSIRYEIGSADLSPERSFYADAALEYHSANIDLHFNLFNNYINNYIFSSNNNGEEIIVNEGDMVRNFFVYRYKQDNANLYGSEVGFTYHPVKTVHFENSFAFTRGINKASENSLPFMPAPVLRNEIRFEPSSNNTSLRDSYFTLGLDNYFAQNKFDPAFETATSGYTLLNASVGTTIKWNGQNIKLYISANNILDKAYVNHLNRLKPEGILNQGRNILFGLHLPLSIR